MQHTVADPEAPIDTDPLINTSLNSKTRLIYLVITFVGFFLSAVLKFKWITDKIPMIHIFCKHRENSSCYDNSFIYRLSLVLFLFYLPHFVLIAESFPRHKLYVNRFQKKYFVWKSLCLLVMLGIALNIPDIIVLPYAWFSAAAAGLFVVIEVYILLMFLNTWYDSWTLDLHYWYQLAIYLATISGFIIGLTIIVCSALLFGDFNYLDVITFSLPQIVLVILFGISRYRERPLLHVSVMYLYSVVIAMSMLLDIHRDTNSILVGSSIIGMCVEFIITAATLIWSVVSLTSSGSVFIETEQESNKLSTRYFHAAMMLSTCYMANTLAHWEIDYSGSIDAMVYPFMVKCAMQIIIICMYVWLG